MKTISLRRRFKNKVLFRFNSCKCGSQCANVFFKKLSKRVLKKSKEKRLCWSVKPRRGGRTPARLGGIYDFSLT